MNHHFWYLSVLKKSIGYVAHRLFEQATAVYLGKDGLHLNTSGVLRCKLDFHSAASVPLLELPHSALTTMPAQTTFIEPGRETMSLYPLPGNTPAPAAQPVDTTPPDVAVFSIDCAPAFTPNARLPVSQYCRLIQTPMNRSSTAFS